MAISLLRQRFALLSMSKACFIRQPLECLGSCRPRRLAIEDGAGHAIKTIPRTGSKAPERFWCWMIRLMMRRCTLGAGRKWNIRLNGALRKPAIRLCAPIMFLQHLGALSARATVGRLRAVIMMDEE